MQDKLTNKNAALISHAVKLYFISKLMLESVEIQTSYKIYFRVNYENLNNVEIVISHQGT